MKYVIKEHSEVFSPEFTYYIFNQALIDKNILTLIMAEVERYEVRHNMKFINFFGNEYLIFREL